MFRDAVAAYPAVSLEEVLARNPEVIVDMGDMSDTVGVTEAHKREVIALWERIPHLAAVKQHRVFAVASDIFVVPGPRVVDAAQGVRWKCCILGFRMSFRARLWLSPTACTMLSSSCLPSGFVAIARSQRRREVDAARESWLVSVIPIKAPASTATSKCTHGAGANSHGEVAFLPQSLSSRFPSPPKRSSSWAAPPMPRLVRIALRIKRRSFAPWRHRYPRVRRARFPFTIRGRKSARDPGLGAGAGAGNIVAGRADNFSRLEASALPVSPAVGFRKSMLVVAVTHDLNLALQFASRVLVLDRGRLVGDGDPSEVFHPERIERVFGVHAKMHTAPGQPPHMTYEA